MDGANQRDSMDTSPMKPGETRLYVFNHTLNTCSKGTYGQIKVEGWLNITSSTYCYAYDFIPNVVNTVPNPTTRTSRKLISKTTNGPTRKPNSKTSKVTNTKPSSKPAPIPTTPPSQKPVSKPTIGPTLIPIQKPTNVPTDMPRSKPTMAPSARPSLSHTAKPTSKPASRLTLKPIVMPSPLTTLKPSHAQVPIAADVSRVPTRTTVNGPAKKPSRSVKLRNYCDIFVSW